MKRITIETIPHASHRYETVGDYWDNIDGTTEVRISDMGNANYEFCVAIHELIEQYLCKKRGISESDITNFDVEFEKNRVPGNVDEPGDDPKAPYRKEHFFATNVERLLAAELNLDWAEYDRTVSNL